MYVVCLAGMLAGTVSSPAGAWPAAVYPSIFDNALKTMPGPFQQLLRDLEPVLHQPCVVEEIAVAVERAIVEFRDPAGSPSRSVAALRDAACAAAAMNDPGMNALVEDQAARFAVVFYGWHPAIQDGDIAGYLDIRREEQTFDLPNRSEAIEVSPEFGMASIAYSHAVTDVANVWLYIWTSVNGAF